MSDARDVVSKELSAFLDNERVKLLLDEILNIEKGARGWCPHCKKQVQVKIPDAKAVTSALGDLLNQSWGTPRPSKELPAVDMSKPLGEMSDTDLERIANSVAERLGIGGTGEPGTPSEASAS